MADDLPNGRRLFIGPDLILRTTNNDERNPKVGTKLCVRLAGEIVLEIHHTGPETLRYALREAARLHNSFVFADTVERVAEFYELPPAA